MQVKLELKIVKSNNSAVLQGWQKEGQKEGQKEQKELTSRQLDIIHLLEETPSATMPQIAESLTITYRSVRRDIDYLQKIGIVSREGGRKEGYWVINK